MKRPLILAALIAGVAHPLLVGADEPWRHSGTITILTTPEGANLPAGAVVEDFPLLVRLHRDWFDFAQVKPSGEDVRFTDSSGQPLAFQIEQWDAASATASIWVRIPRIEGNSRQTICMQWGKADAGSESNAKAVFNEANGYLSVWHLGDEVRDEVGTLESQDAGTTSADGVIGKARHLAGGQGVFGGDKIPNYPTGASPHSTEAWFRPEKPNGTVMAWGNEQAQGKVVVQYRSPPHVHMDCYFSGGNVAGRSTIPMHQWVQVVYTYQENVSRVYVNGVLDGVSTNQGPPLAIQSPARLWLGGWYHHYSFVGDLDEVRVSKVARSADWVRLQYENQKPLQTLVGPLVQPGSAFSVSHDRLTVAEGKSVTLTAQAGGAQKVYWTLLRDGVESPVAVDRFAFTFEAGRVTADTTVTLRFKAVYADAVKTKEIPISIREEIPEPVFTLRAPAVWDGRSTIEVVPQIANLAAMQAQGAGQLQTQWSVEPIAVIKDVTPEKLILRRAQNSGHMVVSAAVSNGGQPVVQTATMAVTEPKRDAWIARTPTNDEKPEEGQFYARDDTNEGTLDYNGTLTEPADSVFLKLYADERLCQTETASLGADKSYALAVKLKPGLIKYRVEFGTRTGGRETLLRTVGDLVCGDAYLINGQSNAVATDWGKDESPETTPWIRTFGSMGGDPKSSRWGDAVRRAPRDRLVVGYWGYDLAKQLVDRYKIPICIINGAVGGTRIDQHQRNAANPEDLTTIYGRLLWRVREARLTHGIRGVLWHQGENDQGADGPTGGYGWETYRQFFIDLAAAWKQDFPNVQHYYLFQIWPKACAMGVDGSDNRLREVQRTLPSAFSNLSIMSTLGIQPPGGCHYPSAGYAEIARLICPLIERDHYGRRFATSITPPNLQRACYADGAKDEIALEFDQPVQWNDALVGQFYLDGQRGQVVSGRVAGNGVTLKLAAPTAANTITYLDSKQWNQETLLRGENGIAALTFCEVPMSDR